MVEGESQWRGNEWADGVRPHFPREVKACGVFDDSLGAVEVVLVEGEIGVLGVVECVAVGCDGYVAVVAPFGLPRCLVGDNVGCGVDECVAVVDAVHLDEAVGTVMSSCEPPVPGPGIEGDNTGVLPDELGQGGLGRGGTPGHCDR